MHLSQQQQHRMTNPLTAIDLFCGCGGFTRGLVDSGINVLAGVDVWEPAIKSYRENFVSTNHHAIHADLKEYPPERFSEYTGIPATAVDILVGGCPCQGFSGAGRRDPKDPRNSLFAEYVKYLKFFKPRAFLFENVMGILTAKTSSGELSFPIITDALIGAGYIIRVNRLYASDFGVPQNRRRVIIVGIRCDLGADVTERLTDVIPPITSPSDRVPVGDIIDHSITRLANPKLFLSERALAGIANKKARSAEEGKGFGAQYLNLDKPSYTIPARYWKDGYDALVKYSDVDVRRLSIAELRRIQSFPDNHIISGTNKDQIMQIGNAVPPLMARHLADFVKRLLLIE